MMGKDDAVRAAEKLLEPPKLFVDRLPVLAGIFERLAAQCADGLRELCAPPSTFMLNAVTSGSSWDTLETYEDSIAGVYYVPEWDTRILIGLDRRFIYGLVDAMYGSDGSESAYEAKRPFSSLETRISKEIFDIAVPTLKGLFAPICTVSFQLDKIYTALEFQTLGQHDVPVVVAQLLFQVMDTGGRMFILIPQAPLLPIRKKLEREHAPEVKREDPEWSRRLRDGVAQTKVTLSAILEAHPMTLHEIANLQVGQIMKLRATRQSLVLLECENQALFMCKLGQSKGYFTLIVDSAIDVRKEVMGDLLGRRKTDRQG
jgi:flagellar motor switch protein FliM